jgi:hypothetical protein
MTFLDYFQAGAGVTLGVGTVILAGLLLLGCFDKVVELLQVARKLRKGRKG